MSQTTASAFNVPTTGQTYQDVGIGGLETFDVSVPVRLMLAPSAVGETGADLQRNYNAFGSYSFQVKQSDTVGGLIDIPLDIAGTPVLQQHVLHVQPNITDFTNPSSLQDYARTELLAAMPGNALPHQGVFTIPLRMTDFVDRTKGDPPVTVAKNPQIPGVQILDSRKITPSAA